MSKGYDEKVTQHGYPTQSRTQLPSKRRKRPLPDVLSSWRLNQRYMDILWSNDPKVTVYIYPASEDGYAIRPMLAKWPVHVNLEEKIREAFGPGRYAVYMRRGETMLLACSLGIGKGPART